MAIKPIILANKRKAIADKMIYTAVVSPAILVEKCKDIETILIDKHTYYQLQKAHTRLAILEKQAEMYKKQAEKMQACINDIHETVYEVRGISDKVKENYQKVSEVIK